MDNITYYIGAGASANALPLYSTFEKRLEVFRDFIYHYQSEKTEDFKRKASIYLRVLDNLIEQLDKTQSSTLDILAHELHGKMQIHDKLDIYQLKYLISDFFIFEQLEKGNRNYQTQQNNISELGHYNWYSNEIAKLVNTPVDPRYKNFILPLINKQQSIKGFSNNLNFISWNYDLQFELSFAHLNDCSIDLAQQTLQVYPSPPTKKGIDLNNSSIIKLNGTAGVFYPDNTFNSIRNFIYERQFKFSDEYLEIMIDNFYANRGRVFGGLPFFKFYFEENNLYHTQALKYAKEILNKTKILVIVGYSFHTSNREIDKEVFEESNNIEKLVIQTLPNDFEHIKYNLLKTKPGLAEKIERYPIIDNFPTPNNI